MLRGLILPAPCRCALFRTSLSPSHASPELPALLHRTLPLMLAIETRQLTHEYRTGSGRKRAIEEVSLSVPLGSIYGFLGPNGAGKTTTIRALMGFIRPSSGHASVLGMDAWTQSRQIKAGVGYVPGDVRLWPWLRASDAVAMFARVRGASGGRGDEMRSEAARLAEALGLDLKLKVRSMSKGTRQKLGLILAMAHKPKLLILDEPSSGLDPLVQDQLRLLLREAASDGRTVFLSSHTLAEVEDLCDRVAIVRQGKIVADDTLAALRARAGHVVTIEFAPNAMPPRAGLLEGLVLEDGAATPTRAHSWTGLYRPRGDQGADSSSSGDVQRLMAWIATLPGVVDASVTRPDLETLFRTYYSGGKS